MGKKMSSDSGDEDTDREFPPLWMMMASQSLAVYSLFASTYPQMCTCHRAILPWNLILESVMMNSMLAQSTGPFVKLKRYLASLHQGAFVHELPCFVSLIEQRLWSLASQYTSNKLGGHVHQGLPVPCPNKKKVTVGAIGCRH